ncbi:MAG: hypothetical protein AAGG68_15565 [Bacteroidota bacterium]
MISYVLKEVEEELEFKISICTLPDLRDFAVGDVLNISRKTNQPFYSGELSAILTKRTLSQDITYNQLFFEELELNGKIYFDVTSRDNSEDLRPLFQHFYNKEFGLIGFVDLENTLWTLL